MHCDRLNILFVWQLINNYKAAYSHVIYCLCKSFVWNISLNSVVAVHDKTFKASKIRSSHDAALHLWHDKP